MLEFLQKGECSEFYSTYNFAGRRTFGLDAKAIPATVSACILLTVGTDTVGSLDDVQYLRNCRHGSELASQASG